MFETIFTKKTMGTFLRVKYFDTKYIPTCQNDCSRRYTKNAYMHTFQLSATEASREKCKLNKKRYNSSILLNHGIPLSTYVYNIKKRHFYKMTHLTLSTNDTYCVQVPFTQ